MHEMTTLKQVRLTDGRKPSQDDVAKAVGITQSFYMLIESGKRAASVEVAEALATYFHAPVASLFTPSRYTAEFRDGEDAA